MSGLPRPFGPSCGDTCRGRVMSWSCLLGNKRQRRLSATCVQLRLPTFLWKPSSLWADSSDLSRVVDLPWTAIGEKRIGIWWSPKMWSEISELRGSVPSPRPASQLRCQKVAPFLHLSESTFRAPPKLGSGPAQPQSRMATGISIVRAPLKEWRLFAFKKQSVWIDPKSADSARLVRPNGDPNLGVEPNLPYTRQVSLIRNCVH